MSLAAGQLVSARQIADMCGVHPKTVHRWASDGKFERVKLGARTYRYYLAEVEKYIREHSYRTV